MGATVRACPPCGRAYRGYDVCRHPRRMSYSGSVTLRRAINPINRQGKKSVKILHRQGQMQIKKCGNSAGIKNRTFSALFDVKTGCTIRHSLLVAVRQLRCLIYPRIPIPHPDGCLPLYCLSGHALLAVVHTAVTIFADILGGCHIPGALSGGYIALDSVQHCIHIIG